jgi:hypothetical protein
MRMPEHVTSAWIDSLSNGDLLTAEARLHKSFFTLEQAQKKRLGDEYDLMRAPAELLAAWGTWSRVSTEARARGLHVSRARSA